CWKHRWHEEIDRLGVDDREADLIWLGGNEAAPDGVALRPRVFALAVKAVAIAIDHDREGHAVETRADATIILWCASVDCHSVALRRITNGLAALIDHVLEHDTTIVRRAADEEVRCCRPPGARQPLDVGLETA